MHYNSDAGIGLKITRATKKKQNSFLFDGYLSYHAQLIPTLVT